MGINSRPLNRINQSIKIVNSSSRKLSNAIYWDIPLFRGYVRIKSASKPFDPASLEHFMPWTNGRPDTDDSRKEQLHQSRWGSRFNAVHRIRPIWNRLGFGGSWNRIINNGTAFQPAYLSDITSSKKKNQRPYITSIVPYDATNDLQNAFHHGLNNRNPRMPTHGSCRPLVIISVSTMFINCRGLNRIIELVGLNPTRTRISCPCRNPAQNPTSMIAQENRRPSSQYESDQHSVHCPHSTVETHPSISTPLTALIDIIAFRPDRHQALS